MIDEINIITNQYNSQRAQTVKNLTIIGSDLALLNGDASSFKSQDKHKTFFDTGNKNYNTVLKGVYNIDTSLDDNPKINALIGFTNSSVRLLKAASLAIPQMGLLAAESFNEKVAGRDFGYTTTDAFVDQFDVLIGEDIMPQSDKWSGFKDENGEFTFSGARAINNFAQMIPFSLYIMQNAKRGNIKETRSLLSKAILPAAKNQKRAAQLGMIEAAYKATVRDNMNDGLEAGLDKEAAMIYGSNLALAEGMFQLVMPDTKFFKASNSKVINNFKLNLKNAKTAVGIREAVKLFTKNLALEQVEELGIEAYTDIVKISTGLITSRDDNIFNNVATVKEIAAATVILAGGMGIKGATSEYSRAKGIVVKQVIDNQKGVLQSLSIAKATLERKDGTVSKRNRKEYDSIVEAEKYTLNLIRASKVSPENVTGEQLELVTKKNELLDKKKKLDSSFHPQLNEEIDAIDNQINESAVTINREATEAKIKKSAQEYAKKLGIKYTSLSDNKAIEEYLKDNKLDSNENLKRAGDYGFIVQTTNKDGTVSQEFIINEQANSKDGVITTEAHEMLHGILLESIKNNPSAQANLGEALLGELSKIDDGQIADTDYLNRLQGYLNNPNISRADGLEEALTLFSEATINGDIKYDEGVFTKIGDLIRQTARKLGFNANWDNGRDVYNFIKDYNKSVTSGTTSEGIIKIAKNKAKGTLLTKKRTPEKKSKGTSSKSSTRVLVDQFKAMENESLVETINMLDSDPTSRSNAIEALIDKNPIIYQALGYNPAKGDVLPANMRTSIEDELLGTEKGKGRGILQTYNPADSKFSTYLKNVFSRRKEQVYKRAGLDEKKLQTDSLSDERVREAVSQETSEPTNTKEDVAPKSITRNKIALAADKTGINETNTPGTIKEISDIVKPILDKLDPTSPTFRQDFDTKAGKALKPLIKKLIGKDYAGFIQRNMPKLLDNLDIKYLVDTDAGRGVFVTLNRRLTKQAEIEKAVDRGLAYVDPTKKAQGANLYDRLKLTPQQSKNYYITNNTPSTTSNKRGKLEEAIGNTIAKDISMELSKDKAPQERKDISEKLQVPINLKFSERTLVKAYDHVFQESFDISENDFAKNDVDWKDLLGIMGVKNIDLNNKEQREKFLDGLVTTGIAAKLPKIFWRSFNGVSKSKIYTKNGNSYIKDENGELIRVEKIKIKKTLKWRLLDGSKLPKKHERAHDRQVFFLNVAEADAWVKKAEEGIEDENGELIRTKFPKETQEFKDLFYKTPYTKKVNGKTVSNLDKQTFDDPTFLRIQDNKMKALKKVALVFQKFIAEGKGKENAALVAGLLKSTSAWQGHFLRLGSPVKFYSLGTLIDSNGKKLFTEEHTLPASGVAKYLFSIAAEGKVNSKFKNIERNYFQGALLDSDDGKLAGIGIDGKKFSYKSKTPDGFNIETDNIWARYFNPNVAASGFGIDPNMLMTYQGKTVYEIYGVDSTGSFIDDNSNNELKKVAVVNNNKFPVEIKSSRPFGNPKVLSAASEVDNSSRIASVKSSKRMDLSDQFNEIIQNKTGIGASKTYARVKAKVAGAGKGKWNFFVPSTAEDFVGLLYKTLGKNKVGDQQMKWYNENLIKPFAVAMENLNNDRLTLLNSYKALKKNLKIVPKNLRKKIPGEPFTREQAVRVYVWTQQGMTVPGLSKADLKELNDFVKNDKDLVSFANQLIYINKGDGYAAPKDFWTSGTISTDLLEGLNTTKRSKYLELWQSNVDQIFSEQNLNKLEAAFGEGYRGALENMLGRMKSGKNRTFGSDNLTGRVTDWLTNSVGAIMFFNTRSAILQTISSINFINFSDNNPLKAGAALLNVPQYGKDFMKLMNSPFLLARRDGLKINVNESDIADMAKDPGNMARRFIAKTLRLGFLPTQIADSFAIASGGATFYRNRIKSLIKQGMDPVAAEKQAMLDFIETAEESQQSSRPDRISMQQAGPLGRIILAFANTPMQYTRLIKKAASDLKNGRGDAKTNVSKIVYYGMVQNLLFNALQKALFALAFGDEEEDEEIEKRGYAIVNSMSDQFLRGAGVAGAILSTLKNTIIELIEQSEKKNPKYAQTLIEELAQVSPPIGSKIRKLSSAGKSFEWNKKEMIEKGWSLDNPAYLALANVVSAVTNLPADRVIKKIDNLINASNSQLETWQRVASAGGWSKWQLGIQKLKFKSKSNKKRRRLLN